MHPIWLLIPLLVGAVQPVVWQMNVRLAKFTGEMESAVLLHVVGTIVGLGWMSVGLRQAGLGAALSAPWWALLGGAIGVTAMAGMNRAIPEVGVGAAIALTVASQLVAAVVFEHFGLMGSLQRPATLARLAGVLLLALGAWLVTRA
ncbi:MAG: hypothetical protein CL927_08245 [Deltaproteobacteria bacterium]|nr:hypothetical protein [Deltaproteobacteria bacterium]HCH64320.1 hypothetical protein [Deltaproteobacteria bacterium]